MNIGDELQKLHDLHRDGALNDEEFAQAKAVILSGSLSAAVPHTPNRAKIRAALATVLNADQDRACVIFTERQSGRFVQFIRRDTLYSGPYPKDLILDLPCQTLDRVEERRAAAFFRESGIRAEEDLVSGDQPTYMMPFGRDLDAAADVAVQIFARVYQFQANFELAIEWPLSG
jgi:hypothetical protein